MKKIFTILSLPGLLLPVLFSIFTSCKTDEEPEVPISKFALSQTEVNMTAGDKIILTLSIEPEQYQKEQAEWSSSAPAVATVSPNGEIKAVARGEAVITARLKDKKAEAKIVVKEFVAIEKVTFVPESYKAFIGEGFNAEVKLEPIQASMKDVSWEITDPSIATIDNAGKLTPLKPGATDIVYKIQGKVFKAPLQVKERIKVINKDLQVLVGGEILIELDKNFGDYGKEIIDVEVADKSVLLLTDDKSLTFTGIKSGKTKLKFNTKNAEGEIEITVLYPPKLLFPNMEWGKKIDDIKAWEKEHGGQPEGELKYDDDLWMDYQDFTVSTSPMQPIPFRRYFFDEKALSKSVVLYPYVLCFTDRGGGMGNFSQEFIDLLKKEGYSEPQSAGNSFLSINKEKNLWLMIEVYKLKQKTYFALTFMKKPY